MRRRTVWRVLAIFLAMGAAAAAWGAWRVQAPSPELQVLPAGEPVVFQRLVMLSATDGWAVDGRSHILRAAGTGPDQWEEAGPKDLPAGERVRVAAAFLDHDRAWVVFGDPMANPGRFPVRRTRDGGRTWEAVGAIQVDEWVAGEAVGAVQLTFVDKDHGWFLTQVHPGMHQVKPMLFATEDGGESWRTVMSTLPPPDGSLPGQPLKGSYSAPYGSEVLAFVSPSRGYAGTGGFYATADGGANWQPVELPSPPDLPEMAEPFSYARPPRFTSREDGFFELDVYEFEKVACPPCDRFLAPPEASYLYVTHDGGQTWTALKVPLRGGTAAFADGRRGWLLGPRSDERADPPGRLYGTDDGGESWNPVSDRLPFPPNARLTRIDDRVGFAWLPETAEGAPALFATADGGRNWEPVEARRLPPRP